MSNIEKIRQEIERRKKVYLTKNGFPKGTTGAIKIETYEGLLTFIDSLPGEIPLYVTGAKGDPDPAGTSDLEEAAKKYVSKTLCDPDDGPSTGLAKESFIAGAEWHEQQMMKDGMRWKEWYIDMRAIKE